MTTYTEAKFGKWNAPVQERFWFYVEKTDHCWNWMGNCNTQGYGKIKIDGKDKRAHRVSYELAYGQILPGFIILHSCDNPRCVRPDHLKVGTYKDNTLEAARKGRMARGERNSHAIVTASDVLEIRRIGRELAERYGLTVKTLGHIMQGYGWKWLPDEETKSGSNPSKSETA